MLFNKKKKLVSVISPDVENKAISGINFRVFTSPNKLPFYRAIKYLNLKEQNVWRLVPESVTIYQDKLKQYIKAGKTDEALTLINYLDELRSMQMTLAEVIEFADCMILLPGEPEKDLSPSHRAAKVQLAENPEIMDFFLTVAVPLLSGQDYSLVNIITYLKDTGRLTLEKTLLKFITKPEVLSFSKI